MALMIDPPSGWQYGFPKEIPEDISNVNEWLVSNGYPQKLIDSFGENFYCRYYRTNEEAYNPFKHEEIDS